jgi:endonuclease-3 related protein
MIKIIYERLLKSFGKQHWWPVTKRGEFIPRYHQNIKLTEKQKLEICFGAILTQNTSWKNVEKAITNLNKNNLIDCNKILGISTKELAQVIKPSGYHNQKSKKLKNFCLFLKKNYNSNLKSLFIKDINKLKEELLSINGIGNETADSIILYAANKPTFVIDTYTKRIFSRIGFCDERWSYDKLQALFTKNLNKDTKVFNEYHALLVELGKNICKKKPLCGKCPLAKICNSGMDGGQN